MTTISSRHNPIVHAFRELAATPDPAGARLLLDGVHLVRDAAAAELDFEVVCVATSARERGSDAGLLAAALEARGTTVVTVADSVFSALSPVRTPAGIVAIAHRAPVQPEQLCTDPEAFLLVASGIQDPGNVGALLRVAEAAGATGAFIAGASANPFSWKALRGSMGSALRLPVVGGLALDSVQALLRDHAIRMVAAVPRDGEAPDEMTWQRPVAIVVGGEGPGLSDDAVEAADARVTIPMAAPVESLNVAVAAAILLYAARRTR